MAARALAPAFQPLTGPRAKWTRAGRASSAKCYCAENRRLVTAAGQIAAQAARIVPKPPIRLNWRFAPRRIVLRQTFAAAICRAKESVAGLCWQRSCGEDESTDSNSKTIYRRPGPYHHIQRRQCVGCTSRRSLVLAFIQPPRLRRHGKKSVCIPSELMTANSRSTSDGAVEIGRHTSLFLNGAAMKDSGPVLGYGRPDVVF